MGKPGKKASNIFQNSGIKNNNGVKLPTIEGIGSPLKNGSADIKKMKSSRDTGSSFGKKAVDFLVHNNPISKTLKSFGKGDAVQSFENKISRGLGMKVSYEEAYADADKKKYPTQESFTKAAKDYNSPAKHNKRKGGKHIVHSHSVTDKDGNPKVYKDMSSKNANEAIDIAEQNYRIKKRAKK